MDWIAVVLSLSFIIPCTFPPVLCLLYSCCVEFVIHNTLHISSCSLSVFFHFLYLWVLQLLNSLSDCILFKGKVKADLKLYLLKGLSKLYRSAQISYTTVPHILPKPEVPLHMGTLETENMPIIFSVIPLWGAGVTCIGMLALFSHSYIARIKWISCV